MKNRQFVTGLGLRLRDERERLGYSQQQLAELAGVKRASQYLYENDQNSPNARYFKAVAEHGIDTDYVFYGQRYKPDFILLNPSLLRDIYIRVDEVCKDEDGNSLPLSTRLKIFSMLCATNTGRDDAELNIEMLKLMLENHMEDA